MVVSFGFFEDEASPEAQAFLTATDLNNLPAAHTFDRSIGALYNLTAPVAVAFKKVVLMAV